MELYRINVPQKIEILNSDFELIFRSDELTASIMKSLSDYGTWISFREKYHFGDISKEKAWYIRQRLRRNLGSGVKTPVFSESGVPFFFDKLSSFEGMLHKLDHNLGASLFTNIEWGKKQRQFLIRGLREEAIASSQIEGAVETRAQAKAIIMKGIPPKTKSQHMIVNNYKMMEKLGEWVEEKKTLTRDVLLEMQSLLTQNTLEEENQQGRWRQDSDDILVATETELLHNPPNEEFLQNAIDQFIAFFEEDYNESRTFIHPLIRASIIHFWIGYLHPFCDGNGRTARALFYWYLMKNGYSLIPYIPISTAIKKSQSGYRDAYLWSEQDDCNLTYFIKYQLEKLSIAIKDFHNTLLDKNKKDRDLIIKYRPQGLNDRQISLMDFLDDQTQSVTMKDHERTHNISYPTALSDIQGLLSKGLIQKQRNGNSFRYFKSL